MGFGGRMLLGSLLRTRGKVHWVHCAFPSKAAFGQKRKFADTPCWRRRCTSVFHMAKTYRSGRASLGMLEAGN